MGILNSEFVAEIQILRRISGLLRFQLVFRVSKNLKNFKKITCLNEFNRFLKFTLSQLTVTIIIISQPI